jgi:hypothetical protein
LSQQHIEVLRTALKNLDASVEAGKRGVKIHELSLIGSIKEIIGHGEKVLEKGLCLSSSKEVRSAGYICEGRWVIVRAGDIISISKVGSDIAISLRGGEFMVMRGSTGVVIGPSYLRIFIDGYSEEYSFKEYRDVVARIHLFKKIVPAALEALRRADESFTRCVKIYRVKC